MDTSLISANTVELLSHLTGQTLRKEDLTPPIVFLSPLITVLTGVMFADKTITDEEKQQWQQTIKKFLPSDKNVVAFAQALSRGVRQQKIYIKRDELLKLTQPLSVAERLLLLGLGYEMSAADGEVSAIEKQYLQLVAKHLEIDINHLRVLEAGFSRQAADLAALCEVRSLLDPARFHDLDTMFVNAANSLLETLPTQPEEVAIQQNHAPSYDQLREFQKRQNQLVNLFHQLYQIIQTCVENGLLGNHLIDGVSAASEKLQSQRFRVAVIGEFSQGKSTLLNALLGEEIQPTRVIPCSGAVTILKYGSKKRVICRYKDGREEEISTQSYKDKAAIPRDVAQGKRAESLADSEIDEIIFEHPDLALCQSGVEIVDSPGLNEHPDRTAITQKLLKDTDAAIFLTNATRLLPEKEKELIQDIKRNLTGDSTAPAENLFIVVNFFDLIDEEEDRHDVVQRLEGFVKDENLLDISSNRVHYISAKASLKASLKQIEDEYLQAFRQFTQAIENFLTLERGALKIAKSSKSIETIVTNSLNGLAQAESFLNDKLKLSETDKQRILDQIGEASGRDVKIRQLADSLKKQAFAETTKSWNAWIEKLPKPLKVRSYRWRSNHGPIWSQDQLIQDYVDQFVKDLSDEIDEWSRTQFADIILKRNLEVMDSSIYIELEAIQSQLSKIDSQINTDLSSQLNFTIGGIRDDFADVGGFLGGIGVGGALAAGLLLFNPIGIIGVILSAVVAAGAGSFASGLFNADGLKEKIKNKVIELGFQKINESMPKALEKLDEIISSTFESRVQSASRVISEAISLSESLLEQQEKSYAATLEQREQQKALIAQNRQQLEQVRQEVKTLVN
ncbi:MAG: dynamin family protein [Pegethrix bostrychoides GSE-TBD4-15B]|jgi:predicted GTPase/uncharacterized tellurite resistance protein B-like protein|uniref:Dynamin family protein n=1 Tax=Pegethrix bostrychoides GSE-TBD4-15B TaxID=2839662 RepID=A0A951U855_9CYAN|nr:dynamin family protein [Pegethrix bostrychoides GSE-TBD4-15B]